MILALGADFHAICGAVPTGRARCLPTAGSRVRSAAGSAGTARRCRPPVAIRPTARRERADPHRRLSPPSAFARRGQRERARVVAAGEFHQRRHARIDRRMGVENIGKSLARIVDAHFHDRGGRAFELAAALDLAQRRDHRVRILGELDRAGVGEIFALARQREADDDRQNPGDGDERDGDEDRHPRALAVAARRARRASSIRPGTAAGTRARRRTRSRRR